MANDFSSDSRCQALWRFENGAITVDSRRTNSLTNANVSNDVTIKKEGDASAYFNATNDNLSITDANLSANFPLKSGDTVKKISTCFWFRAESLPGSGNRYFSVKSSGAPNRTIYFMLQYSSSKWTFKLAISYDGTNMEYLDHGYTIQTGRWYHVGVFYNNADKSYLIRIWDDTAGALLGSVSGNSTNNIVTTGTGVLTVGQAGAECIAGWIDEFVVFNDIISIDEIDAIREGVFPITATSPPPTTSPPTTSPPTTSPPTTSPPTTIAPTTIAPTTPIPTTLAPTTILVPTTVAPTLAPTPEPTTLSPTTPVPTTLAPTTILIPTLAPTTVVPTPVPTTLSPTTIVVPTTLATTIAPTTPSPTLAPTTYPVVNYVDSIDLIVDGVIVPSGVVSIPSSLIVNVGGSSILFSDSINFLNLVNLTADSILTFNEILQIFSAQFIFSASAKIKFTEEVWNRKHFSSSPAIDWLTLIGNDVWPFIPQPDKPHYNEGDEISDAGMDVWNTIISGIPVTPQHRPWCGYWFRKGPGWTPPPPWEPPGDGGPPVIGTTAPPSGTTPSPTTAIVIIPWSSIPPTTLVPTTPPSVPCSIPFWIEYTSLGMGIGESQQLSIGGGTGNDYYVWTVDGGGGEVDEYGVYIAPDSNANCLDNPTITATCVGGGGASASIEIAVNALNSCVRIGEIDKCYQSGQCGQHCFSMGFTCMGSDTYESPCFGAYLTVDCRISDPLLGENWRCYSTALGSSGEYDALYDYVPCHIGVTVDGRSASQIAQGCCPPQLL